jgi:hypothetical protein
MILSCSIAPSSLLTNWNTKTKILNKYKISKFDAENNNYNVLNMCILKN